MSALLMFGIGLLIFLKEQVRFVAALLIFISVLLSSFPLVANAQTNSVNHEVILVGLFVNDTEIAAIDALEKQGKKYLPLDLVMKQFGITPQESPTEWFFHSPIGDAAIKKSGIINYRNQSYVALDMFKPLGVTAVYDQSSLAIKLYVPWDNKNPFPKKSSNKIAATTPPKSIDYYPQQFGLDAVSISGGVNQQNVRQKSIDRKQDNLDKSHTQTGFSARVGLAGHLMEGLWGASLHYNRTDYRNQNTDYGFDGNKSSAYINNLYWVRSGENWAARIGTNSSSYGLGSDDYTGVTMAYSNKNVKKHLAYPGYSNSQLLSNNFSSSKRNIKGVGPAGGIAELRVNGRPVARVRIPLDKKYEFIGLDLDRYNSDSNVEVAIFEYSLNEQPMRVDKPYLSARRSNVDTGELLTEVGLGQRGNWFDRYNRKDREDQSSTVGHAYAEYGLHNNIAIRGAVAKDSDFEKYNTMFGVNIGLPFRINMDLSYENLSDKKQYNAYLDYSNQYIGVNYNYQRIDHIGSATTGYSLLKDIDEKSEEQHLDISLQPTDNITLGLYGTHKRAYNKPTERYFTASLNARLHDNLSVNVHKDRHNDYRYGVNWYLPQWRMRTTANWNNENRSLQISKQLTDSLDVGVSVTDWKDIDEKAYHAYMDYTYNDRHRFHVGVGQYGEQKGYDVNWRYQHNDYASLNLGYRKNQSLFEQSIDSGNSIFNDADYFYLQFNLDFVNRDGQGFEFGQHRPSYYGTVISNIHLDDNDAVTLDDSIKMKIDNYSVNAYKVSDNQYRIENVKPGVYTLEFPMGSLPLDYQTKKFGKSVIKVSEAAPTVVDYKLEKSYGISGQLITEKEGVLISLYQGNKKVTETYTGPYGYYQIIGLPAGKYLLKSSGRADKVVTLTSAFLFEVDL